MIKTTRDIIGLDPKLLTAFVAAAEELHFGRAAARMYMSQPPFSQLIQRLESVVGAQLFERTTRSVRLTSSGQVMLRNTRPVLDQLDQMLKEVQRAALGETGALCIGMAPTAACSPIAEKLYVYRQTHPQIELELREMNSNAMEAALRQRTIDVALMRPLSLDSDIEVIEAMDEPMLLAVRKDSAIGQQNKISLEEIAELPLIGYVQAVSPYFRQMLQAMFVAIKRRPRIVQESMIPTILTLVEAGVGAAVVPWSVSRTRDSVLAFISISNAEMPRARIIVAKRAGLTQDAISVNEFVAALQR